MTRWALFDAVFIGFENFAQFFRKPFLIQGLVNAVIYAAITSGLKVVIGMAQMPEPFPYLNTDMASAPA